MCSELYCKYTSKSKFSKIQVSRSVNNKRMSNSIIANLMHGDSKQDHSFARLV